MKKAFLRLLLFFTIAAYPTLGRAQVVPKNANEHLVVDFYNLAFNAHKPAEAARLYLGSTYIQHNPHVANGAADFVSHFEEVFRLHPATASLLVRVLSDGDYVVLHSRSTTDAQDRGQAIIDIFRIADGKIVEHWDVIQPVPEHSANGNTMFSGDKAN